MCADQELEPWGIMFNASFFWAGKYTGTLYPWVQPSYVIKKMIWGLFLAVFLKMGAMAQKGRITAVSSSPPDFG
jgi:hypothetical protein